MCRKHDQRQFNWILYLLIEWLCYTRAWGTVGAKDKPDEATILKDLTFKYIEKRTYTNNYFTVRLLSWRLQIVNLFGLTSQTNLYRIQLTRSSWHNKLCSNYSFYKLVWNPKGLVISKKDAFFTNTKLGWPKSHSPSF